MLGGGVASQVVKNFDPATAISSWPAGSKALTEFGLQYGLKDDLAPPNLALALQADLKAGQLDIDVSNDQPAAASRYATFLCCT